jgi:Zn-dependent protease with chaperone function
LFSNLIFLILVLLLTSFALEIDINVWTTYPWTAFLEGMVLYGVLLAIIYFQNLKKWGKRTLEYLVNLEILGFLTIFFFVLGGHRLYSNLPFDTLKSVFTLILYFFALGFYHYTAFKSRNIKQALQPILLILPFALPFLIFTLLLDMVHFIYPSHENSTSPLLLLFIGILFIGLTLTCLPALVVRIWKCQPLEDSDLKLRLERLCRQANFKHAGIKTWTVMNGTLTAAIIGVVPSMRYVMFTRRLLNELPPENIEAILAHEIGHSYRKHLLIFPFIILGMLVIIVILSLLFSDTFNAWFMLQSQMTPSPLWNLAYSFTLFLSYGLIIAFYFRYVFGLFSRLFERQADLHCYELHLDPQEMIDALNTVAIATGFTHLNPNWHHYSIQERIDFLKKTQKNPREVLAHHHRTRRYLIGYFLLLFAGIIYIYNKI